jgi:hypothetical protein
MFSGALLLYWWSLSLFSELFKIQRLYSAEWDGKMIIIDQQYVSWKETVLTTSRHYYGIRLESLGKTNRKLSQDIRMTQVRSERGTPRISDQSITATPAGSVQSKGTAATAAIYRVW